MSTRPTHQSSSSSQMNQSSHQKPDTTPESLKNLLSKYGTFLSHFQQGGEQDDEFSGNTGISNSELDMDPQHHIKEIYQHLNRPGAISSMIQDIDQEQSNLGGEAMSQSSDQHLRDLEQQMSDIRQQLVELQSRQESHGEDAQHESLEKWIHNNEEKQQYSPSQLQRLTSDERLNETPVETGFIQPARDIGAQDGNGYASDDEADSRMQDEDQLSTIPQHSHRLRRVQRDEDANDELNSSKWSTMSNPPSTRRSSPGSVQTPFTSSSDPETTSFDLQTPSDAQSSKSVAWSTKTNPPKSVHPASGSDIPSVMSSPSQKSRSRPSSDDWSSITSLSMSMNSSRALTISETTPQHSRTAHQIGSNAGSHVASSSNSLNVNLSAQDSGDDFNFNSAGPMDDGIEDLQPETVPSPIEEDKPRGERDSMSTRSVPSTTPREGSPTLHVISSTHGGSLRGNLNHTAGSSSSFSSTPVDQGPPIPGRMKIYTPSHTYRVPFSESKHSSLSAFLSSEGIEVGRTLTYEDEEGDWITIRNEEEWQEAIRCWSADNKQRLFRVRVQQHHPGIDSQ